VSPRETRRNSRSSVTKPEVKTEVKADSDSEDEAPLVLYSWLWSFKVRSLTIRAFAVLLLVFWSSFLLLFGFLRC